MLALRRGRRLRGRLSPELLQAGWPSSVLCYQCLIFNKGRPTVQSAQKISITLTPDMLRAIRESVDSGEYASTSEAMRDAVRVRQRQRLEQAGRLAAMRARVRRSLNDPRPDVPLEEAFERIERLHAKSV
jgi:antitoxin ParD1/3/4